MAKYIVRLDDASQMMDTKKWDRIEAILEKYHICPLVGIIPNCKDPDFSFLDGESEKDFWEVRVARWKRKGWEIALHGYEHVFRTCCPGINPVNNKSEFAGVDLAEQRRMIREGIEVFHRHDIDPNVFFAPAHTFDDNTISALLLESNIRFISDTPSFNIYKYKRITFVPQQTGLARRLPFPVVTFCYHPNIMDENDFNNLEAFLVKANKRIISFPLKEAKFGKSFLDKLVIFLYFLKEKIRKPKH